MKSLALLAAGAFLAAIFCGHATANQSVLSVAPTPAAATACTQAPCVQENVRTEMHTANVQIPVQVREKTVHVPGPTQYVEVPGPTRYVQVPGPERVVVQQVAVPQAQQVQQVQAVQAVAVAPVQATQVQAVYRRPGLRGRREAVRNAPPRVEYRAVQVAPAAAVHAVPVAQCVTPKPYLSGRGG